MPCNRALCHINTIQCDSDKNENNKPMTYRLALLHFCKVSGFTLIRVGEFSDFQKRIYAVVITVEGEKAVPHAKI